MSVILRFDITITLRPEAEETYIRIERLDIGVDAFGLCNIRQHHLAVVEFLFFEPQLQ